MSKRKSWCFSLNVFTLICFVTINISLLQLLTQYNYTLSPEIPTSNLQTNEISLSPTTNATNATNLPHRRRQKHKKKYNVWIVCTIGFNSSHLFVPYFIEWYKNIGIKPEHFLLNIHLNEQVDDLHKFNQFINYLHSLNVKNYSIWRSSYFTSNLKKERERELISLKIPKSDYIVITDVDELQDWNNYGIYNIYDFIQYEMIPNKYEYVTGYLVDRFAENASLINAEISSFNKCNNSINISYNLFNLYPFSCDFTETVVFGIIDKVCLYKNIYRIAGGGHHQVEKRLIRYNKKKLRIKNTRRNSSGIRGDSILRYKNFRIKIHHFKWKKNVIYYLKQRAMLYKEKGIVWWKQSQNAVDWLEENAGNVNLHNISEFDCKYDPIPSLLRNDSIDILLCSDEKDKIAMFTLINSIIYNEKKFKHRLNFHILVLNEIEIFQQEINKYFGEFINKIHFEIESVLEHKDCIKYNKMVAKYMRNNDEFRLNDAMNFARFCLPFIFKQVQHGIYLDVDMVFRKPISTLYDRYYDKNEYVAWSVLNRNASKIIMRESVGNKDKINFINHYLSHTLSVEYPSITRKPIDFSNMAPFFNGGILMFNLNIWRKQRFTEQSVELFKFDKIYEKKFGVRPWVGVTQPIYNLLFIINQHKVADFGAKWNFVVKDHLNYKCKEWNATLDERKVAKSAGIVHWAGGCKPWTTSNAPLSSLWNKYNPINNVSLFI